MTITKLKSDLLTITALIIFALTANLAKAQNAQNIEDNPIGITVNAPHKTASVMHFYNKDNDFLGGFQMRKYSDTNYQSGLLDANGGFNYMHKTNSWTSFIIGTTTRMRILNDGKVIIGSPNQIIFSGGSPNSDKTNEISANDYKLFVQNGILTEKVKIAGLTTDDWADYVFADNYELMPINQLESFIAENKHLPNVPSAEEVAENGLDIAKTDAKLLEKIEESHLYIIELNNKFNALQEENNALKADLETLKTNNQSQN